MKILLIFLSVKMASKKKKSNINSSSSDSSSDDEIPAFPFQSPVIAPPPRAPRDVLDEWVAARAPFANHMTTKDWIVYQRVRERRNSRITYEKKVKNPDTGELARLEFSNKAAVSIS